MDIYKCVCWNGYSTEMYVLLCAEYSFHGCECVNIYVQIKWKSYVCLYGLVDVDVCVCLVCVCMCEYNVCIYMCVCMYTQLIHHIHTNQHL